MEASQVVRRMAQALWSSDRGGGEASLFLVECEKKRDCEVEFGA